METNERLTRDPEREKIRLKCNFHFVCTTPGLVQSVELMLPPLAILFITIQILDSSLIDLSIRWVIIQLLLILFRLLPFLFSNIEEPFYFKRSMLFYEMGMTIAVLVCYIVAIPFILSKDEPRVLNMLVFMSFGIIINAAHIGWIIYRLIYI